MNLQFEKNFGAGQQMVNRLWSFLNILRKKKGQDPIKTSVVTQHKDTVQFILEQIHAEVGTYKNLPPCLPEDVVRWEAQKGGVNERLAKKKQEYQENANKKKNIVYFNVHVLKTVVYVKISKVYL